VAAAQQAAQDSTNAQPEQKNAESGGGANAGVAEILANTTESAAHKAESWGSRLGLGKDVSFGISLAVNFAGIVLFCWVLLKSRLPQAFRERTVAIQKGIRDAEAASADASRRLTEIEARLGKLDSEVAEIRQSAEHEAAAEEERVRQAAEQDKQRIIQGAEAEIEAMARNAQRELKGYAASLAVDLAGRQIHVDDSTDHVLVREFVGQLGKDGQ
jgi:F-type H+-transporting ATPase subunit b